MGMRNQRHSPHEEVDPAAMGIADDSSTSEALLEAPAGPTELRSHSHSTNSNSCCQLLVAIAGAISGFSRHPLSCRTSPLLFAAVGNGVGGLARQGRAVMAATRGSEGRETTVWKIGENKERWWRQRWRQVVAARA
ncbi:hypothetical protein Droror1_Dr00017338 [Drosera rotundifolia]